MGSHVSCVLAAVGCSADAHLACPSSCNCFTVLFATDAFWAQYFSAKSLHTAPDMLNWFSRGWAFVLLSMGISSYQHCNGFGISFFNLVSQVFYTVYFAGMVFGAGIGAEEKTFADTKQMWQLQLGIK